MVDTGRELLERMELAEAHGHRLELLSLQVRLSRRDRDDPAELATMLAEATAIGRTVLDRSDQTAPSGIVLGQLIRDARERGVEVPHEADEVFAELNKWAGGALAAMIAATAAQVPTPAQLAGLVAAMPPARYAEDVGYDMGNIATLAQRSLSDDGRSFCCEPSGRQTLCPRSRARSRDDDLRRRTSDEALNATLGQSVTICRPEALERPVPHAAVTLSSLVPTVAFLKLLS